MKTITIQVPDDCEVQIVKKEEKKKEPTIRTFQDLIDNHIEIGGYWVGPDSEIGSLSSYPATPSDINVAASEKVAKSMLAMSQISQLMPFYGGAITDEEWNNSCVNKYTIFRCKRKIDIDRTNIYSEFLAFHTKEQRDEFLKYNERLVKDYLMLD